MRKKTFFTEVQSSPAKKGLKEEFYVSPEKKKAYMKEYEVLFKGDLKVLERTVKDQE